MIISDQQREENFLEYLRLKQNPDYYDATFDDESGGVSAVHKEHKFDKQMGPYGSPRGEYERTVMSLLRRSGYRVLLESERSLNKIKKHDGTLNDWPMDIKTIEGSGQWSVSTKLREAEIQGAQVVALYFPDPALYSKERVLDGIEKYETNPDIRGEGIIKKCIILVADQIVSTLDRTTTPSAGWF